MKYILALFIALTITPILAQDNYTFFTDRRFFDPSDLIGYQFVPNKMEIPKESKKSLAPGEVSFGITGKNLYVKGEGIKGVYNINNINSEDYGYKLTLMNARNPASQGHLKVILTKGAYVDVLVFKKDRNESEIIFVLPEMTAESRAKEKAFFTDWGEVKLEFPEDIWGKVMRPFIRVTESPKMQQRLYASDSVKISFEHVITEIDKSKPAKNPALAEEVIEQEIEIEEPAKSPTEEAAAAPAVVEEEDDNASPFFSSPKPKSESSESDSPFFSSPKPKEEPEGNDSPFFSSPKKETKVEKVVEAEPKNEEPALIEDPDAIPPIGEDEVEEEKVRRSKIKIIEEYYIKIKSLVRYDDGTQKIEEKKYNIKKWTERADETARAGEEKYQIEFQGDKGRVFYLYLTTERAISSFQYADQKLLVRD